MRLKCAVIGAAAGLRKALPEYLTGGSGVKGGAFFLSETAACMRPARVSRHGPRFHTVVLI